MMQNSKEVRSKYHENLARLFGVEDYSVLEKASTKEKKAIIAHARKVHKFKSYLAPDSRYGGNPYVMLGRKINNKGKIIK